MNCILSKIQDPYFNLATEEYLLKSRKEDFFILYRNEPSVIVGKHQNALAEINWNFVSNKGIKVARRMSGGGTVYHDRGNLNFAFIKKGQPGKLVDFKKHVAPIREVLGKMGINTKFEGHNSLSLDGFKVSGNAEHVFKNRILHHGTLLYSTRLEDLDEAIKIIPDKYFDKAVKSVRAEVANISDTIKTCSGIEEFESKIMQLFIDLNPGSIPYILNPKDLVSINKLKIEKYETWEWIFSYAPKYKYRNALETGKGKLVLNMYVDRGIIEKASIRGSLLKPGKCREIEAGLCGMLHKPDDIRGMLIKVLGKEIPMTGISSIFQVFF